jgi:hypothetical protein
VARADARRRFSLGDSPAGAQVLEVRHIGYLRALQPVELRNGRTVAQDVRLQRIATLDSIRVLARRSHYRDFEEHRKRNGSGRSLHADQIGSRDPLEMSGLVRAIPAFRMSRLGIDAKVTSSRGVTSMAGHAR